MSSATTGLRATSMSASIRPRRSVLFMPGSNPRALEKARELPADGLIFDLEDAVVPERRPEARTAIVRYLAAPERRVPLWVRVNPVDSSDALLDLAAVMDARPDGIMLPKARSGADVLQAHYHGAAQIDAVALGKNPHDRRHAGDRERHCSPNVMGETSGNPIDALRFGSSTSTSRTG